jgi:hypothetical protein
VLREVLLREPVLESPVSHELRVSRDLLVHDGEEGVSVPAGT